MNCANHPDRERQAFCQNCGKPLCRECARTVGQAVFCEPCLEARLAVSAPPPGTFAGTAGGAGFGTGPTSGGAAYQAVPGGTAYRYTGTVEGTPYDVRGVRPPAGTPNPALAALLGFIPGVGAMYNGQYAKGLVHLIVFAILVSLADHSGIFGLFVAAWIFYQAFEAYHTARARREGTPLPNPFGLNDVGERLGFGRAWTSTAVPPTYPSPPQTPQPSSQAGQPVPEPVKPYPESTPFTGAEAGSVHSPLPLHNTPDQGWSVPPPPYVSPEAPPAPPAWDTPAPPPEQTAPSLPIGAFILIGLGLLFLVGDTHWVGSLPFYLILPIFLIGTGAWIFIRRMTAHGSGFTDDGSAAYRLRVLSAVRASIWIVLVGILFLLDSLNILSWGRSWPLFIIVAGVLAFLHRSTAADVRRRSVDASFAGTNPPAYTPSATRESER